VTLGEKRGELLDRATASLVMGLTGKVKRKTK